MHLGLTALSAFFKQHEQEDSLVLATVIETRGSTYRKPGAMMLISAQGGYAGMISGGCLESDLLEHAANVFKTGEPVHVTYDMYADEQLVWSLGLGCDGVIILLLQRLDRQDNFGFLPWLFETQVRRVPAVLAVCTRSDSDALHCGSWAVLASTGDSLGSDKLLGCIQDSEFPPARRYLAKTLQLPAATADVLLVDIRPVPKVLICGAGPDALPLSRLIAELGWESIITDHRAHYAKNRRFPGATRVVHARPEALADEVDLTDIDAAVIMSHHLDNDFCYLQACLSVADISYIGILGPASRREKLLVRLESREVTVFGPVGLDIGAELPESIALSVVAEIHAVLNQRRGNSLTRAC